MIFTHFTISNIEVRANIYIHQEKWKKIVTKKSEIIGKHEQ